MTKTALGRFRLVSLVEGISYLLLLGVAMPLKYVWGMPFAVKISGWAHGVLFVLFGLALLHAWGVQRWSLLKATVAFAASLIPFGAFVLDRALKQEREL